MFPSYTDTTNRLSYPTSSYNYYNLPLLTNNNPPFFINHENTINHHHHHQDPTVTINPNLLSSSSHHHQADPQPLNEALINYMAFSNNFTMPKQNFDTIFNNASNYNSNTNVYPSSFINHQKPPVKKDRHSKIYTAQGLRDRRVRLSMVIAREFFDLQDMLGFDKASKTLEWLLAKSRKAIKEVSKMKGRGGGGDAKSLSSPSNLSSEFEEMADEEGTSVDSEKSFVNSKNINNKSLLMLSVYNNTEKKAKMKKIAFGNKDSRAKARARARERTKEKNSAKQVKLIAQFEASEQKSTLKIEDPKLNYTELRKRRCSIIGCQQNVNHSQLSSNDQFNNINTQNWEIIGAVSRSTFCTISNTNLSTGLQIHGKQIYK